MTRDLRAPKARRGFIKWLPLYLMLLPGAAYLIVNNYLPMAGLVLAFKRFNYVDGMWRSPWAGFSNFTYLFQTRDAFVITRNTLVYNALFMLVNTVVSIALAIFMSDLQGRRAKRLYQSAVLMPFLMSYVIVSYLVYALLSYESGLINHLLASVGGTPVKWYSEPSKWALILVLVNLWKGAGYSCLIYMAAVNGIDREMFEAAELDGAGKCQQIRYVTLPCLVPTIITLLILSVGKIFYSDFSLFYQVPQNSGALYSTTNVIDTYVYRALLQTGNVGMSSAAGFYQSFVGFVLVLGTNLLVRRISSENALF